MATQCADIAAIGEIIELLALPRCKTLCEVMGPSRISGRRHLRCEGRRITGQIERFRGDDSCRLMVTVILADYECRQPSQDYLGASQSNEAGGLLQRLTVVPAFERLEYILARGILSMEEPNVFYPE